MTKLQKDAQRVIKHLEKAAEIASQHEITDGRGGFVDSQFTAIATEIFYKYINKTPKLTGMQELNGEHKGEESYAK